MLDIALIANPIYCQEKSERFFSELARFTRNR
jgi:hypothetical protein